MQVIKSKAVVKLSMQELEDAVRLYVDKNEGYWIDELEIELDGYEIVKSEQFVSEDNQVWIEVPKDWKEPRCPITSLPGSACIEAMYRNGSKEIGTVESWRDFWIQDNVAYDIIKFRIVK